MLCAESIVNGDDDGADSPADCVVGEGGGGEGREADAVEEYDDGEWGGGCEEAEPDVVLGVDGNAVTGLVLQSRRTLTPQLK